MTFLPIQLPPGIVRGANPDDVPGRWFDGSLVRWREGVMEPVGGWSRITSTPLASTPRLTKQWRRNDSLTMTLVACDSHLYTDNSGAFVDVAPADLLGITSYSGGGFGAGVFGAGTFGTPRSGSTALSPRREIWSLSNWGEDMLAVCSADGRLLYYDASAVASDATVVGVYSVSTISRATNVSTIVTSAPHNLTTGDVVVVSGVADATYNSTSASVTVTNDTTFTYANAGTDGASSGGSVRDTSIPTANRAVLVTPERHVMLLGAGGDMRRLGWSSREDYLDFNYASTTNTAGFLDLQSETPLVNFVAVREGTLVWSGNRAFLIRYVGLPFVYGADELGSTRIYGPNTFAEFEGKVVWMDASGFTIYDGGAIRPLPCPLVDYVFANIDPIYGPIRAHASVNGKFDEIWFYYPSVGATECDRLLIWNYTENWWSIGTLGRTSAFRAGITEYPIMTGTDKHLYQHENGWSYDTFDLNNIYVTSGTINMPDAETNLVITQLLPSNGGNYELTNYTFYTRLAPNGIERTFGPYTSRSDGYVDCRVSGRDVRIRVGAAAAGDWSIGRMRAKVGSGGGRR